MSLYASVSEYKARVPERGYSGLNDSLITQHLTDASEVVDSYVAGRGYELPLQSPGNDVKSCVCSIALFTLMTAKGFNINNQADEAIQVGRDNAILWLRDVAKGVANLSSTTVTPARRATGVAQVFSSTESTDRDW